MQVTFNEQIQFGDWIRIIPKGTFYRGGQVYKFDEDYLRKLKENFDKKLFGQDVPVNFEHQLSPLGAAGWVKALEVRDDGLYAQIEWTDIGKEAVEKGRFKYVSVELGGTVDPKTGKELKDVLTGLALTNRPFFKALTALAAADPDWVANDDPLNIPIHDDRNYEWDADESEKRWRSWVSEKDPGEWGEQEWRRYRRRFLAYDRANPYLFGSYKLPVVDIVNDGQPRVIFRAVVAVLAALAGARGGVDLPSEVKERVRSIAERIRSKFEGGERKMSEQVVTVDEFQKVAAELEQVRKEQRRLQFKETLSSITFNEGKYALAPSIREKLLSILVELNDEQANKLLDAIRSIQFVPLGEVGFSAPQTEEEETLQTFAEKLVKERNITFSEAIRLASVMRPDLAYKHFSVRLEGGEK
ncbi:MAG: phage protease [Armatimonadota bacterium]|nr:phage protease [Armatimonadota bacterium]MDW8143956.1 phage protease [Armatimonadota bacterium]